MQHSWIQSDNKKKCGELKDIKKNMQSLMKRMQTEKQKNMEKLKKEKEG